MLNSASRKEKIRRVTTACDNCRNKKVRCDGPSSPSNRCSICMASNIDCTYFRVAKKRGPPKEYVSTLEARISKMEKLIRTIRPDIDLAKELDKADEFGVMTPGSGLTVMTELMALNHEDDEEESSDYESAIIDFSSHTETSAIDDGKSVFFGKSSDVGLYRAVSDMRMEHLVAGIGNGTLDKKMNVSMRRPEFWKEEDPFLDLQIDPPFTEQYTYPDPPLLSLLLDIFFEEVNVYLPIFHRPSMEKSIAEGLYLRDQRFGVVVLLMCAVASRQTQNPKITAEIADCQTSPWFRQVFQTKTSPCSRFSPVRLAEVQAFLLSALYLMTLGPEDPAWLVIGVGIRLCQDVGIHRRKVYGSKPTAEGELWKRVFWCLLVTERWMSCGYGRQGSLREEDFDLDYPIDCDDEYWFTDDPDDAFKQPKGKPSRISYFISYLELTRIAGCALRTLYANNKSKVLFNMLGPEKEKIIVADLDSALNKWADGVPDHLKWDPKREDMAFFKQSGHLYAIYYHVQILVHRPFLSPTRKTFPSDFPSLAICTNAARQCAQVAKHLCARNSLSSHLMLSIFTCAILLLVDMWRSKVQQKKQNAAQVSNTSTTGTALDSIMTILKQMEQISFPAFYLRQIVDHLRTADINYEGIILPFTLDDANSPRTAMLRRLSRQRLDNLNPVDPEKESTVKMPQSSDLGVPECPAPTFPAVAQSNYPVISSPDIAVYNEMMSIFDDVFSDPSFYSPSTTFTPTFSSLNNNSANSGQTGGDPFAMISSVPTSIVGEDWNDYMNNLPDGNNCVLEW